MKFLTEPLTDLTYSDVFLTPSRSDLTSRMDVDISAGDGTGATIPLVAANMNGVTGRRMAETMARRGGLAVLPQDVPAEIIAETISWVKSRHTIFETPLTVTPDDRVLDVNHLASKRNHDAVCVVEEQQSGPQLLGIVRVKDCHEVDHFASISSVMRQPVVTVDVAEFPELQNTDALNAKLAELYQRFHDTQATYIPVLDGTTLVGVLTLSGVLRSSIFVPATDPQNKLRVAAALGINGDVRGKAQGLVDAGVDVLVVDTAHGHQAKMIEALRLVRDLPVPIVAGNVVSADGVRDLIEAGADIIKVGVGPGAMCTTRMMTAVGRPQFSAVYECAQEASRLGKQVWADGGVRYPRDVALALAAGASQVMVGSWFAGTFESPGDLFTDTDGRRYKENFGMASARAVQNRTRTEDAYARARKAMFEEGISSSKMHLDPQRPSVEDLLDGITAGLRSSMTYAGAMNLAEFHERAVVGVQSAAGYEEGRPVAQSW